MKTQAEVVGERWRHRDFVAIAGRGRHAGALATQSWLAARGLLVPTSTGWEVSIALDVRDEKAPAAFNDAVDTRFHLSLSATEWGFFLCQQGRASWIRVTDVPFVHERDDFALLFKTPPLRHLGALVRELETTYRIRFRREHASIRSTIAGSEPAIWEWVLADI
jgi:hypothetical protein